MSLPERIVVSGMGLVTSIGDNVEDFFANAVNGTVSISQVKSIDTSRMKSSLGGEIVDFSFSDADSPGGRATDLALAAAQQIFNGVNEPQQFDPFRIGVAFGFTQGEAGALEAFTDHMAQGNVNDAVCAFQQYPPKLIAQYLAKKFSLFGPNYTLGQACSAGNFCLGLAIDALRCGDADAMLVGGADAFSRYNYAGFSRLGAIATDTCRPFSLDRKGMVPAEGAGLLLIETLSSAQQRGADIVAEIVGYGESSDAYHITQPSVDGVSQAIISALEDADLDPQAIDYISVHGTGTIANDRTESAVLKRIFTQPPPVSSLKSMIGHTMGAAASIEAIATIMAMIRGVIPPTMSFLGEDPDCAIDCVANHKREAEIRYALKTASAFGGQNAAVIFRRWVTKETDYAA